MTEGAGFYRRAAEIAEFRKDFYQCTVGPEVYEL